MMLRRMMASVTALAHLIVSASAQQTQGTQPLSAAKVAFTQGGAGAVPVTFDDIFRATWVTPEMYGATCSGSDDGPGIQRALNYAGSIRSRVRGKPCAYTIVTPVVDNIGVEFAGYDGEQSASHANAGTIMLHAPSAPDQIAYRVRNAGNMVLGGGISNVMFYSNDTTTKKTALEVEDVSRYRISKVRVAGALVGAGNTRFWGGAGSIGVRLRGREFTQLDDIDIAADFPLVLSDNPNSTIDSDWLDARKIYLRANGNANILMEDGVNSTHMSFDGVACVLGTHCFKNLDTTSTGSSLGWTFHNFGIEQGQDSSAYNFLISRNTTVYGVEFSGFQAWDSGRNGAKFRNVQGLTLGSVFYQGAAPSFQCLDVDNSVRGLSWSGSSFFTCSTTAFTGQTQVRGESLNGMALPRAASYASTVDDAANNVTYEVYTSKSAPAAPAAGNLAVWFDSINATLQAKNSSNSTYTMVAPDAGAANNFLTALGSNGLFSKVRPSCATLSDAAGSCSTDTTTQANVSFTGLSAAAAVADADAFPTNKGAANLKQTFAAVKTWIKGWIAKADVGLGSVDNTSDATKAVLSAAKLASARTIDGQSFDGTANVTVIAPGTHAASSKTTPVDADEIPLVDSAASNVLKKLTWANLKATLKSYFDTLYVDISTQGVRSATISSVNFNAANTDNAIAISLPAGYTRFMPWRVNISNPSISLATATFGIFSATGAGGVAIQSAGTATGVSSASDATSGNASTNTTSLGNVSFVAASLATPNTIYFRVGTAAGSPATGDVQFLYFPVK